MGREISYADALKILGIGNSKALSAVNTLLGGAILGATVATGQLELLTLLHARDELLEQSGKLLASLGQRVRGANGKSRTDLLVAAHAVVAVNAYFKAMRDMDLPVDIDRLELTQADQIGLAGVPQNVASRKMAEALIAAPVPRPLPQRPYERVVGDMRIWYGAMSERLVELIKGLAVWDDMGETGQDRFCKAVLKDLPAQAVVEYKDGFRILASESPEFRMWTYLTDSAATRAQMAGISSSLESGLAGLQALLEDLGAGHVSSDWPGKLAVAYRAQLRRPIVDASADEVHAGLVIPSLAEAYVNPKLRVAEYGAGARPAEESWWQQAGVSGDIQWFLAGYLTSPVATEVPLLIVGHPGSGKSLFTKVLAARLPPEDYMSVRVELRRVVADAPVQDQIETALREATGERMEWPTLARAAGDALPVVMLDGFDELLQATEMSRSDYLLLVREFQRREAEQGRRVAVVVTSRIVVADRLRLPEGTVMGKLEPFDDAQVERWLATWNVANSAYMQSYGLHPLSAETVLAHRELAEQPLLLLMLALYDADGNGLQQQSGQLARADLYERLLSKFANRELEKREPALDGFAWNRAAAKELQQLSVVAFAMFNRGKKAVTDEELDSDLAALLPQKSKGAMEGGQFSRRLTRAQLAVGRFFFIHRSQALVDDTRLNEYEFLHATFGEYLVARLVFHTLDRVVKLSTADDQELALSTSAEPSDDDLWVLLSFSPLTDGSQTLAFLNELFPKMGDTRNGGTDLERFQQTLAVLFRNSLHPRPKGYGGYAPRYLDVPARHAAYSANLLVLNALAARGPLSTNALFAAGDRAPEAWRRLALLWKSQLEPVGWEGLVNAFTVTGKRGAPELKIHTGTGVTLAKPIEEFRTVNWLAPPAQEDRKTPATLARLEIGASELATEVGFLRSPELDLLMHDLYPFLRRSGRFFNRLIVEPDGTTKSFLHFALNQLLEFRNSSGEKGATNKMSAVLAVILAGEPSSSSANLRRLLAAKTSTANIDSFDAVPQLWESWSHLRDGGDVERSDEGTAKSTGMSNDMLLLCLPENTAAEDALKAFPWLPSQEEVFNRINPMELAEAEPPVITAVVRLAREKNYIDWAEGRGLALLAALPDAKLGLVSPDDLEFILESAATRPGRTNVITLIRDRREAVTVTRSE